MNYSVYKNYEYVKNLSLTSLYFILYRLKIEYFLTFNIKLWKKSISFTDNENLNRITYIIMFK